MGAHWCRGPEIDTNYVSSSSSSRGISAFEYPPEDLFKPLAQLAKDTDYLQCSQLANILFMSNWENNNKIVSQMKVHM